MLSRKNIIFYICLFVISVSSECVSLCRVRVYRAKVSFTLDASIQIFMNAIWKSLFDIFLSLLNSNVLWVFFGRWYDLVFYESKGYSRIIQGELHYVFFFFTIRWKKEMQKRKCRNIEWRCSNVSYSISAVCYTITRSLSAVQQYINRLFISRGEITVQINEKSEITVQTNEECIFSESTCPRGYQEIFIFNIDSFQRLHCLGY